LTYLSRIIRYQSYVEVNYKCAYKPTNWPCLRQSPTHSLARLPFSTKIVAIQHQESVCCDCLYNPIQSISFPSIPLRTFHPLNSTQHDTTRHNTTQHSTVTNRTLSSHLPKNFMLEHNSFSDGNHHNVMNSEGDRRGPPESQAPASTNHHHGDSATVTISDTRRFNDTRKNRGYPTDHQSRRRGDLAARKASFNTHLARLSHSHT
jgi:hypothetical protein